MTKDQLNKKLLNACIQGNLTIISDVLKQGADINTQDDSDQTPLHLIIKYGNFRLVKYFIDQGANPFIKNSLNQTPFYLLIIKNASDLVQYIIEKKQIDPNKTFNHNQSILMLVCSTSIPDLNFIKYLIAKGADVYKKDDDGRTAFNYALGSSDHHTHVIKFFMLNYNFVLPLYSLFKFLSIIQEVEKKDTQAQSLFNYFLKHKNEYTSKVDLLEFKERFLKLQMSEEDSKNLKPIVKFL